MQDVRHQAKWVAFTLAIERIAVVLGDVGGYAATAIMILIVGNIVVRLFPVGAMLGTYEIVELLAVVFISFALISTTLKRKHVIVNALVSRLSQPAQAILASFTSLLVLVLLALLAWAGGTYAMEKLLAGEVTHTLNIPLAPFRYVWVVAVIFLFVLFSVQLVNSLSKVTRK